MKKECTSDFNLSQNVVYKLSGTDLFVKLKNYRENGKSSFFVCDEVGNVKEYTDTFNKTPKPEIRLISSPYEKKLILLKEQLKLF